MRTTTATVTIGLALAACGGTGEDIDAVGCTFLQAGPFVAITAGAARDGSAPAIDTGDHAFRVTLPAAAPGYLAFASPDDTEYAIFTSRTVDVAASTPAGTAIPPAAVASRSDVCAEIMGRTIIELPVGAFFLAVGPDAGGPVDLVLRPYNPD